MKRKPSSKARPASVKPTPAVAAPAKPTAPGPIETETQLPPKPPTPPPNIYAQFMEDLREVFIGKITPPGELFCPISAPDAGDEVLGIASPRTRELFSLASRINQKGASLPHPKNISQKPAYDDMTLRLKDLVNHIMRLVSYEVRGTIPAAEGKPAVALRAGWEVVAPAPTSSADEDESPFAQMAKQFGIPEGLVRAMVYRRLSELADDHEKG